MYAFLFFLWYIYCMKSFKLTHNKTKIIFLILACFFVFITGLTFLSSNQKTDGEKYCQVFAATEQTDSNTLSKNWASALIESVPEIQSCRTIKSLVFDNLNAIPTGYSAKVVVSVDTNGSIFASYKKIADSSYDVIVWSSSTIYFPTDSSYLFGSNSAPSSNTFFSLTNLVFKNINTSNVVKMTAMFQNCMYLENLNLSMFDTQNVEHFDFMFYWCTHLQTVDISSFRTPKAQLMTLMFYGCKELLAIDLTHFDTTYVTNMSGMFRTTYKLQTLVLGEKFTTSNVTSMNNMFDYCGYDNIDVSSFDTSKVKYMNGMFIGCEQTELDLSSFNTENVLEMSEMFYCCSNLTNLNVSSFDVSKVTDMSSMFSSCASLQSLDLKNFNTQSAKYMNAMFSGCSSLSTLNIENFNTKNVQDMTSMFANCASLENLDLSHFDTKNVTSMKTMFNNCSKLKYINLLSFDTSKVTNMQSMFFNNKSLIELDLSGFDLCSCTSQSVMMNGTTALKRFVAPYTSLDNTISISLVDTNDYYIVSDYDFGKVTTVSNVGCIQKAHFQNIMQMVAYKKQFWQFTII